MSKNVSTVTTDYSEIQTWVESYNGKPARVRGTGNGIDPGLLRIDFPGGAGKETLEEIPWEELFKKYEDNHLAFLYQKRKSSAEGSTFFKLVHRN
jgi:hypothetical protein